MVSILFKMCRLFKLTIWFNQHNTVIPLVGVINQWKTGIILNKQGTVDSKIDENRCKQNKYELIQVMGDLYRYLLYMYILNFF